MIDVNSEITKLFSINKLNVVITGASRGIGLHLANFFHKSGSNLLLVGRKKMVENNKLANFYESCDVNDLQKFKSLCQFFRKKFGLIDVLINNAGISIDTKLEKNKFTDFKETLDTNLISNYRCCEIIFPLMRRGGSIINISSVASLLGMKKNPGYVASKGALNSLTKSLAEDYSKKQIRVNAILPGYIRTKMTEKSFKNKKKNNERIERTMLRRWGEASDLIGVVVFLATESSSYVTGSNIIVDGGFSIKGI